MRAIRLFLDASRSSFISDGRKSQLGSFLPLFCEVECSLQEVHEGRPDIVDKATVYKARKKPVSPLTILAQGSENLLEVLDGTKYFTAIISDIDKGHNGSRNKITREPAATQVPQVGLTRLGRGCLGFVIIVNDDATEVGVSRLDDHLSTTNKSVSFLAHPDNPGADLDNKDVVALDEPVHELHVMVLGNAVTAQGFTKDFDRVTNAAPGIHACHRRQHREGGQESLLKEREVSRRFRRRMIFFVHPLLRFLGQITVVISAGDDVGNQADGLIRGIIARRVSLGCSRRGDPEAVLGSVHVVRPGPAHEKSSLRKPPIDGRLSAIRIEFTIDDDDTSTSPELVHDERCSFGAEQPGQNENGFIDEGQAHIGRSLPPLEGLIGSAEFCKSQLISWGALKRCAHGLRSLRRIFHQSHLRRTP